MGLKVTTFTFRVTLFW